VHELSIAVSLVEAVCDELPRLGAGARVDAVRLRVGPLAGVVKEALLFSFDVAADGSPLEGARLEIEETPVTAFCAVCQAVQVMAAAFRLRCPVCGAPTPDVEGGRELELVALEVSDGAADR